MAPWLAGLLFSVLIGFLVTPLLQKGLESYARLPERDDSAEPIRRISPHITGTMERVLFACLVAFDVSGWLAAMIGWTVAKMAANWNSEQAAKFGAAEMSPREIITRRFSALITGTASLTIAAFGGLIWRGAIPAGTLLFWASVDVIIVFGVIRIVLWYEPSKLKSPRGMNARFE